TLRAQCDMGNAEGRARFVHEARPLVTRIAAPLLRLQVIKSIAEESALTQQEVEQAFGLNGASPARQVRRMDTAAAPSSPTRRPPRAGGARRRSPSKVDTLLRLVLHHLQWAARLPVDLIPGDTPQARALISIIDAISVGDLIPGCGLGALVERFRDTEHGETLARAAGELVEAEFDDAIVETLFEDALRALHADAIAAEIAELTTLAAEGGLDT